MSRYAYFNSIKSGVVFSDPLYDENVKCQYRKAFTDKNWFMKLDTSIGEYDSLLFDMTFGRSTFLSTFKMEHTDDGTNIRYPVNYKMEDVELGIDSARMFCGSMDDFNNFGESIAFSTGGDGWFGNLFTFTARGEDAPAGFVLFGNFSKEFMTEDHLFNHFISSFQGREITEKEFFEGISHKNINNIIKLAEENGNTNGNEDPEPGMEHDDPDMER